MFEDVVISSNESTEEPVNSGRGHGGESVRVSPDGWYPLPAQDRAVLLLWDAGMGCTEIADRSALPIDAVGRILDRARFQSERPRASVVPDVASCRIELTEMDLLFNSVPR